MLRLATWRLCEAGIARPAAAGQRPSRISRWACPSDSMKNTTSRGETCPARCNCSRNSSPSSSTVCPSVRSVASSLGRILQVLEQEQLAQVAQQVADELRVVGAFVREALDELERLGRAPLDDDVGDLEEQVAAGDAQRLQHVGGRDRALGVGDQLVQGADGVAEPTLRVARDDVQRLGLDADGGAAALAVGARVLALHDAGEHADHFHHRRAGGSRSAGSARGSWRGTLCGSVVAKTNFDVRRRLLQRLEQRVEGLAW